MKNKSLIVLCCIIFLTITYCLSFIKTNSKENRKPLKTSLLNPKNVTNLEGFTLLDNEKELFISKTSNDQWEISDGNELNNNKIPADQNKMANFIDDLSKVINIYEISKAADKNSAFGIKEDSTNRFLLTYYLKDGSVTELSFGNYDFSEEYRYFTQNGKTVYEISKDIDKYLSTSIQSWSEPEIISKTILGNRTYKDVQRVTINHDDKIERLTPENYDDFSNYISSLFELRHGGFADIKYNYERPEITLTIDFGDKTVITINIYTTEEENTYILCEVYNDNINNREYSYKMKISSWTYNKIKTSKL